MTRGRMLQEVIKYSIHKKICMNNIVISGVEKKSVNRKMAVLFYFGQAYITNKALSSEIRVRVRGVVKDDFIPFFNKISNGSGM